MLIKVLGIILLFFILEILYFLIAKKYRIVDKPNNRSSHRYVTIRGGGIIFPIAALFFLPYTAPGNLIFGIALLVLATLSFIDDIKSIESKIRLLIQSLAVIGLLYVLGISLNWILLVVLFVMITGIINAYNFMDGINGITVFYSLITICSLFWVSSYIKYLQPVIFFISLLASLSVFAFFNVRKQAICFAGDIGAVSMAFMICFLLFSLIMQTDWIYWIFFLTMYGIDTVFTIMCRIFRKEPLMQAHRSHFYQYLANERGWAHIQIAFLYASIQGVLNIVIIHAYVSNYYIMLFLLLFAIVTIYSIFRFLLEGPKRLFTRY